MCVLIFVLCFIRIDGVVIWKLGVFVRGTGQGWAVQESLAGLDLNTSLYHNKSGSKLCVAKP